MTWRGQLKNLGYAHFARLIPQPLVTQALEAIELDLANNYHLERQAEYDNQSYCPNLKGTEPITGLLIKSPVLSILDALFGIANIDWDQGQIAIRHAHNCPEPVPPEPHIDGFSSGLNALEEGRVYNHTITVGVFLTRVARPFAGNFAVWPGSHLVYENYFHGRGLRAMSEPMPKPETGTPIQLMCEIGDVALAHYQLGHAATVNTSDFDRIAVYFRVWLRNIELNRWHYLTNIWEGWNL